jgi:hypothetical protein
MDGLSITSYASASGGSAYWVRLERTVHLNGDNVSSLEQSPGQVALL